MAAEVGLSLIAVLKFLHVALLLVGVDGQDDREGPEDLQPVPEDLVLRGGADRAGDAVVVVLVAVALILLEVPEAAARQELPAVHDDPLRATVAGDAGQLVVELVRDLHLSDAGVPQLIEDAVDVLLGATRVGRWQAGAVQDALVTAVERLGYFHPLNHGKLALVDDLAGLERVVDDAEPALARPALLSVDVVLKLIDPRDFAADRVHLVAVGLWLALDHRHIGIDLAQNAVLDHEVHEDAQAPQVGAFKPAVIRRLVRERVLVWPAVEIRPAASVVTRISTQARLEHRRAAVRLVVSAVLERIRSAELVPRLAAVRVAAEELEGHHVHVAVDGPLDLAVAGRVRIRIAGGVEGDLRIDGAAFGGRERKCLGLGSRDRDELVASIYGERQVFRLVHDRELAVRAVDYPSCLAARRGRDRRRAPPLSPRKSCASP